jgi:hypothetical protein
MMWLFSKIFEQRFRSTVLALALVVLFSGCATRRFEPASHDRSFNFAQDTLAFPNELVWEYFFDEKGKWTNRRREPVPDYTHHCFVVAHLAKQFFQHAQFAPQEPRADDKTYRKLIRKVVSQSDLSAAQAKIVIPGFANLREFSEAKEPLLKEEGGGAWQSYFQRGHWRIMLPFTRRQQEATSKKLDESLDQNYVAVAHLIRFPQLTINHAIVLFDSKKIEQGIEYSVYDPNKPDKPAKLIFDRATRTFLFPANDYFIGGKVNVYEVYRSCFY